MTSCVLALGIGIAIGSCTLFFIAGAIRMWRDRQHDKKLRELAEIEAWEEWKETR